MRRFLLLCSLLINLAACQPVTTNPASSTPMLTVRDATNCRSGPGTNYDIVFTYPAGTKLEITGRDEARNFWLVKSDKSPTGTCWMWTGSVDVTGNALAVAIVTPTSAPTGTGISASATPASAAPTITSGGLRTLSIVNWKYSCSNGTLTFTVNWENRLADETGFRIFRNGEKIAELPADSTTYTDILPAGQTLEYYVQVYSPGGSANSSVMKAAC